LTYEDEEHFAYKLASRILATEVEREVRGWRVWAYLHTVFAVAIAIIDFVFPPRLQLRRRARVLGGNEVRWRDPVLRRARQKPPPVRRQSGRPTPRPFVTALHLRRWKELVPL